MKSNPTGLRTYELVLLIGPQIISSTLPVNIFITNEIALTIQDPWGNNKVTFIELTLSYLECNLQ